MSKLKKMKKSGIYTSYFKYIMEHKKNVFKVCWKKGMYWHAITHDLSKFLPSEFIPYANWFYGAYGIKMEKNYKDPDSCLDEKSYWGRSYLKCKEDFEFAWVQHFLHNKHHWNHWCYDWRFVNLYEAPLDYWKSLTPHRMPSKYIDQMICDWDAMSIKFGNTSQDFYMKNYDKMELSIETRLELEFKLGLICMEYMRTHVTWRDSCKLRNVTMEEDLRAMKVHDKIINRAYSK